MGNISSNHSINNPPKVCCVNCFDIKEIKDFIAANNVHGKCNYCQSNNVYIAEAEEVGRFIIEGISRRYEDAANNVGYEGEYLLPTQTISEVIFDLDVFSAILKNPEVLLADLVRDDGTPYIRKHPYSIYQDEEDFDTWESFCQLVKYKDRYTVFINRENQTSENDHLFFWARILNDLFTYCNSTLEKGAKIYRARLHNSGFKLDNENLTSPPPRIAG